MKSEAHTNYKLYGNMLATLLKRSKHRYFSPDFQNHIDLKNTWKGIKRIISLIDSTSTIPSTIIEYNISLTNPKDITHIFNNNFYNLGTDINFSRKYSRNKFFDFFPQMNINSFFIIPSDKLKLKTVFCLLNV